MKNSLLFSFSVFSFLTLKAQTVSYQPIHGDYTQYVYHQQHWNGSENVESFSKTIWSGDTIIGGQHYVRIFQDGVYSGGIREDVPNQQRFFVDLNNVEKDITISHFLTAGTFLTDSSKYMNAFRTYFGYFDNHYDTLYVDQVDSVLEANGTYSATYHLRRLPEPNTFVFNTYRGLLSYQKLEFSMAQVCYREDGAQTEPGEETPWTWMCDLGMDEANLLQIELFPNPSSESLNLSGDLKMITDLAIYDLNGKMIKQVPLSDVYSGVSLKELKNGIYFFSVNEHQKVLRFQKM
jgi:hypothetical protein